MCLRVCVEFHATFMTLNGRGGTAPSPAPWEKSAPDLSPFAGPTTLSFSLSPPPPHASLNLKKTLVKLTRKMPISCQKLNLIQWFTTSNGIIYRVIKLNEMTVLCWILWLCVFWMFSGRRRYRGRNRETLWNESINRKHDAVQLPLNLIFFWVGIRFFRSPNEYRVSQEFTPMTSRILSYWGHTWTEPAHCGLPPHESGTGCHRTSAIWCKVFRASEHPTKAANAHYCL